MPSVPELALAKAEELGLDLHVSRITVPTRIFTFKCIEPKGAVVRAFKEAADKGHSWVEGMPVPVLTYHSGLKEYRIMDGMMRICAAQIAGIRDIPALVASGELYEILEPILDEGYYGEDFVDMLAMVNEEIRNNRESRDSNRLSGK